GSRSQMRRHLVDRLRKNYRLTKPEPLRNPQQPLQKRYAEQLAKRLGSAGQNEQLRSRCLHEARETKQKGFTAVASEATLKFMVAEVSLSCEGIERYLGEEDSRVHALRGVTLQLERGSVHAIVGPSGCGKSTLLYILGLLDRADSGTLTIDHQLVSGLPDDRLSQKRNELLGFIFQFHFLLEDFTAQENVTIPMRRLGRLTENEMRNRASDLLNAVDLGDKLERPSRHLSGGEQQRVAVARALANDPRVILADEPTGNLDTANSERAFELLQNIVQQGGKALLLATHNPVIAESCDWIHEMKDGRITASNARGTRNSFFK